jgi:hypothetical protein
VDTAAPADTSAPVDPPCCKPEEPGCGCATGGSRGLAAALGAALLARRARRPAAR